MKKELDRAARAQLQLAISITEFSKWLTVVFVSIYILTWAQCMVFFYVAGVFPFDILDFVLAPTKVVVGFYFASSGVTNIFKVIGGWTAKSAGIPFKDVNFNSTSGYDYSDFGAEIAETEVAEAVDVADVTTPGGDQSA